MTPEQKAKILAQLESLNVDDVEARSYFMLGVGYALTLSNEPVGDDETDAHKYGLTVCPLTNQAPQALLYKSIAITAFLAGRKGMVPKSAVEEAVKSERERCITAAFECMNESFWRSALTPTNQGEKE